MDGRRIFINAGALIDAKGAERGDRRARARTGHMAGGHLSRLRQQLANAQRRSIIAMILGLGGAIAASRGGGGGNPAAPFSARRKPSAARCCPTSARKRSRPTARV